jgi:hypothetical protein
MSYENEWVALVLVYGNDLYNFVKDLHAMASKY